jgi:hypothetical protein
VLEFKYTGEFVRVFAEVNKPRGLLYLAHLDPPQVVVCSAEDGSLKFLHGTDGSLLETYGDPDLYVPYTVARNPEDPNAVLIGYEYVSGGIGVQSYCAPDATCTSGTHDWIHYMEGTSSTITSSSKLGTCASKASAKKASFLSCSLRSPPPTPAHPLRSQVLCSWSTCATKTSPRC